MIKRAFMVVLGILLMGGLLVGAFACAGGEGSLNIKIDLQQIVGETSQAKFQALVNEFNRQGMGVFHIQGTYYENYQEQGPTAMYLLELFYELDKDVVAEAEALEAGGKQQESWDLLFENAFQKAHPLIGQIFMYTSQALEVDSIHIITIFPENSIRMYQTKPKAVEILANEESTEIWEMYVKKYIGYIYGYPEP